MSKTPTPQATISELKERFREGAIPLQSDFATLIDMAHQGAEAAKLIPADHALGQGLRKGASGLLEINCNKHDFSADHPETGRLPLQIDSKDNMPCVSVHHGLQVNQHGLTLKTGAGLQMDKNGLRVDPHFFFPRGMIVMWSGKNNDIPQGWILCDGANNTPDLTDRFVVGRGKKYQSVGGKSSYTTAPATVKGKVTVEPHALTEEEMPEHNHLYNSVKVDKKYKPKVSSPDVTYDYDFIPWSFNTSPVGKGKAHTHQATLTTQPHSHVVECTPPYYALAFIMKM